MNTPVIISSAHPALLELPTRAVDKPRAWDMTPINLGHALALIFVRLFLISLIASGGWEVALWVRVSQKKQKSEFWYTTNPTGFHRLDEPPEKVSAL